MTEPAPAPASQEQTPQADLNAGSGTPPSDNGGTPPAGDQGTPPSGTPPEGDQGTPPDATPPAPVDLTGEDWREQYSSGDDKKLNILKRYGSQKDALDALFSARGKLSESSNKELPDNATDDQKAAFRADNGIPAKAEEYGAVLPEGLEINDVDKPIFDAFFDKMHQNNMPQELMNDVLSSYALAQQAQQQARLDADDVATEQTETALRDEWGPDYKANKNMIKNAISLFFPKEFHSQIENARLADGTPLFASKEGAMSFAGMARKLAPHGTTVTSEGTTDVGTIESNLKAFETQMGTTAWHSDTGKQQQYRDLVTAYERNTGKVWTGQ